MLGIFPACPCLHAQFPPSCASACLQGCGVATFSKPFEAEAAMRALGALCSALSSSS